MSRQTSRLDAKKVVSCHEFTNNFNATYVFTK